MHSQNRIAICLVVVMTSLVYALPSDNFNDNLMNTTMWNRYASAPAAWLAEANERLELRSTEDANGSVVYWANGWGFLTTDNFSFKTDFHCSAALRPGYYEFNVVLGLGKFENAPNTTANNNVTICAGYYKEEYGSDSHFSCDETANGTHIPQGYMTRSQTDGILYISYDATADKLYLSTTGYWVSNAWVTISGLLQGEWGVAAIIPFLGGGFVYQVALNSGEVYLDNFTVDSGMVVPIPAVYFYDLENLVEHWLYMSCVQPFGCEGADLDNDTNVDFKDFAILARNWLVGI